MAPLSFQAAVKRDANGTAFPPTKELSMTTKPLAAVNTTVSVPVWALTAFFIPALLFVVWFTSFYVRTTDAIVNLKADYEGKIATLEKAQIETRKDVRLQDAWLRETRELLIQKGLPASQLRPSPDISRVEGK